MRTPTADDARAIIETFTKERVVGVQRFTTGVAHWVYELCLEGRQLVVKIGKEDQVEDLAGSVSWTQTLRPLGVPLPEVLAAGTWQGLPYVVIPRLPGCDLGLAYHALTSSEKRQLAAALCEVQQSVHGLPVGNAFGFAKRPGAASRLRWRDVVQDNIERSASRIRAAGLVSPSVLEPLREACQTFDSYFAAIRPIAFLDDTTTKNVLVHNGALSGIVDVDWICYGDPLFVVALTRVALLNVGHDTEYTDAWAECLEVTERQRAALEFYSALFCADFLGELGQDFNGNNPPATDEDAARLLRLMSEHLART